MAENTNQVTAAATSPYAGTTIPGGTNMPVYGINPDGTTYQLTPAQLGQISNIAQPDSGSKYTYQPATSVPSYISTQPSTGVPVGSKTPNGTPNQPVYSGQPITTTQPAYGQLMYGQPVYAYQPAYTAVPLYGGLTSYTSLLSRLYGLR